jgi:hypothetical protein
VLSPLPARIVPVDEAEPIIVIVLFWFPTVTLLLPAPSEIDARSVSELHRIVAVA